MTFVYLSKLTAVSLTCYYGNENNHYLYYEL